MSDPKVSDMSEDVVEGPEANLVTGEADLDSGNGHDVAEAEVEPCAAQVPDFMDTEMDAAEELPLPEADASFSSAEAITGDESEAELIASSVEVSASEPDLSVPELPAPSGELVLPAVNVNDKGSAPIMAAEGEEAPAPEFVPMSEPTVGEAAYASTSPLEANVPTPASAAAAPEPTSGYSTSSYPATSQSTSSSAFLPALLGALVGAALALLIIYALNGTLMFGSRNDTIAATTRLNELVAEADTLNGNLDTLATRIGTTEAQFGTVNDSLTGLSSSLDDMGTRVAAVEGMRDQVDQTISQVSQLSTSVTDLGTAMDEVRASSVRFDRFLGDLRAILDQSTAQ